MDRHTDALLVDRSLWHGTRLTANASAAEGRDDMLYIAIEEDALSRRRGLPTVGVETGQYMRLEHDDYLRLYEWRSGAGWVPVLDVLRLFLDGGCSYHYHPSVCRAYGVCTVFLLLSFIECY